MTKKEMNEFEMKMEKFTTLFDTYLKQYTVHQEAVIKLGAIKKGIINFYDKQDERIMKTNGVVIRTKTEETYELKEEIYEYLEDHGFLPLVATIDKSVEKYFNIDHIKHSPTESVRLYTGGRSLVNKGELQEKYQHLESEELHNLTDSFKSTYTSSKLEEAKLKSLKEQLFEAMPQDSISIPNIGTIKKVTTYEYNPSDVFELIAVRKEAFIKPSSLEEHFDVIIYPDDVIQSSLHKDTILDGHTLHSLHEITEVLKSSSFIKKSQYNKLVKEGYKPVAFETPGDPYEFFRACKISKTKLNNLITEGAIPKKDIEPFIIKGEIKEYREVLTEGTVEIQRSMFDEKLMRQAEKYRERNDPNYEPQSTPISTGVPVVEFTEFSF